MNAIDSRTAAFIRTAHRAPRLSREQELELVARLREGDRAAKDRLVTCHLREVVFIALKFQRYGVAVADLIAEGNLGLMRAVEKFDPAHGVRFATYAAHWIRSFVVAHVLGTWSVVCPKTGVLRTRTFFKLRRERAKLESLGLDLDEMNGRLAERMGVSKGKVERMLERMDSRDLSLDAPAHADSRSTFGDLFTSTDDPEKTCDDHRIHDRLGAAVQKALESLDPRERFIVDSRWLADPDEQISLADIGRKLGVSRERARQLEARARSRVACALAKADGIGREWLDASAA